MSEFNPNEGTLLFDYDAKVMPAGQWLFRLGATTGSGSFIVRHRGNGDGNLNLIVTGTEFNDFNSNTTSTLPLLGKHKIAVTYQDGKNYRIAVDGVIGQVASTRSPALPPLMLTGSSLSLLRTENPTTQGICEFTSGKYFPKSLTDAELIELTKV